MWYVGMRYTWSVAAHSSGRSLFGRIGLPFVIKIISVNGSKSMGEVFQKCRSTWQDLFNRYACACCVMSNEPQDPLGTG